MIYIDDLDRDDLPEVFQDISDLVGVAFTQKIMLCLSGRIIYFPVKHSESTRKKYIARNYDGENVTELSRRLECSPSTIYRLLGEKLA